jgi:hypothetical protein
MDIHLLCLTWPPSSIDTHYHLALQPASFARLVVTGAFSEFNVKAMSWQKARVSECPPTSKTVEPARCTQVVMKHAMECVRMEMIWHRLSPREGVISMWDSVHASRPLALEARLMESSPPVSPVWRWGTGQHRSKHLLNHHTPPGPVPVIAAVDPQPISLPAPQSHLTKPGLECRKSSGGRRDSRRAGVPSRLLLGGERGIGEPFCWFYPRRLLTKETRLEKVPGRAAMPLSFNYVYILLLGSWYQRWVIQKPPSRLLVNFTASYNGDGAGR